MARAQTYKTSAIVLRKTKLAERDLIVTLLDESGALLKCVAKGARKPGGSYAAKLELFSCVDIMCARGRNLDVITDARFARGARPAPSTLEQAACASCISELLAHVCQEDLEHPRLFEMANASFDSIAAGEPLQSLLVTDAALLKVISVVGFKPSFECCPVCGRRHDLGDASAVYSYNIEEGGVVCAPCSLSLETSGITKPASVLAWSQALLYAKFADIPALDADMSVAFDVLEIVKPWIEFHAGKRMKSLDYIQSCGLF